MGCVSSRKQVHNEFFKVDDRVMAIKRKDIRQIRNPHTGDIEDTLYGAKWSHGIITAVKMHVITKNKNYGSSFYWPEPGSAYYKFDIQTRTNKKPIFVLLRKYTVTFDTGDSEVDVPIDRLMAA